MMNKKRNILCIKIIMMIFILGIIYSILNIIIWYKDNKENSLIKEELGDNIEIIDDKENPSYDIDFKSLKEKNSDTIAYLKVNNTNIDYVVVQGKDNKFYLKHNFKKKYNRSGWIFMDYHNKFDGTDKNIVIYGHNTKDGSMFGTLKKVITKDWYMNSDNYFITLIGEDGEKKYQVFSTYSIKKEDYYINTYFKDNNEFNKFIATLKKRSLYDYNVSLSDVSSILTLSTCTSDGRSRVVLHAKLVN